MGVYFSKYKQKLHNLDVNIYSSCASNTQTTYYNHLGRVHPVVHKYTVIFIYICRLYTTSFNDMTGNRFRSYITKTYKNVFEKHIIIMFLKG